MRTTLAGFAFVASLQLASAQTIPASLAAPPGSVNTNAPGFKVRTFRVTGLQVDSVAIAESLIAGASIDPNTGMPYQNMADAGPNPDGSFFVDTVVNWDQGALASGAGNFPNDEPFPGIPGPADDFVVEVTGFIEMPAGNHRVGVNSDDGFNLRWGTGLNPYDAFGLRFAGIDTTRWQANTEYNITIQTNGLYPFRLLFWERDGDARLEFFNFLPGNQSTTNPMYLINDRSTPNAFKSYGQIIQPFGGVYASLVDPAPGGTTTSVTPFIRVDLQEQAVTVNTEIAPMLILDGTNGLTTTANRVGTVVQVRAQAPTLALASLHSLALTYTDSQGTAVSNFWQFTVSTPPPRLTIVRNADSSVTVSTSGGTIQQSDSLTTPSWMDAGAGPITVPAAQLTGRRYYRARQ